MEQSENHLYYKGYLAGYRAGVNDAICGKAKSIPGDNLAPLPIQAMGLSVRANNCLCRAGCVTISDVAALSEQAIAVIRNMGPKTASEIANWLYAHHILYTAWEKYL